MKRRGNQIETMKRGVLRKREEEGDTRDQIEAPLASSSAAPLEGNKTLPRFGPTPRLHPLLQHPLLVDSTPCSCTSSFSAYSFKNCSTAHNQCANTNYIEIV